MEAEQSGVERSGFWDEYRVIECSDGKKRRIPVESIFQFTFDGISNIMGSVWDNITSKIERWVMRYAEKTKRNPGEILREMWSEVASQTLRQDIGRFDGIYEPEILLIALCKLQGDQREKFDVTTQDISTIQKITLRTLWGYETFACPSQKQGLDKPPGGQSYNALFGVPLEDSQYEDNKMFLLRPEVTTTRNVPEAFPEMEKIWRSIFDESEKTTDSERLYADKNAIVAMGGFPLSQKTPGAVMLLLGAGNAIVPQVAAVFIKAFMDTMEEIRENERKHRV